MGDLDGRTFLITGANTGIGYATTGALAARGATVYMACRSEARTRPARDEIAAATGNQNLHVLGLDLADLASVRACADTVPADGCAAARPHQQRRAGRQARDDRERLRAGLRHQSRRPVPVD
jgi:NAD(P)-dependent dehydrogenase (short-subunit alcohol dehydrogenase family)